MESLVGGRCHGCRKDLGDGGLGVPLGGRLLWIHNSRRCRRLLKKRLARRRRKRTGGPVVAGRPGRVGAQ